jgi:hypothetical protein
MLYRIEEKPQQPGGDLSANQTTTSAQSTINNYTLPLL